MPTWSLTYSCYQSVLFEAIASCIIFLLTDFESSDWNNSGPPSSTSFTDISPYNTLYLIGKLFAFSRLKIRDRERLWYSHANLCWLYNSCSRAVAIFLRVFIFSIYLFSRHSTFERIWKNFNFMF